jgi:uncharacterized protein (DUF58 family)
MIPRELIKKLRKIEIRTSKLANEQLAGGYHSVFKGRGMAFSEVRQYQPGDDVRFIDWNVSARMNETYVKVFTEEREMTVMLLVDLSGSERFGSVARPKVETVAEVSALLAFSAIKNNDRVGLILFTDRVEKMIPPKKGKGHVMRVVTEILNARPEGEGTDLTVALEALGHVARRRSVAFLVSDFIAEDYERAMRIAAARHDLIPIQVIDPREEELPNVGLALFEDLETGDLIEVDTADPYVQKAYRRRVARDRQVKEELFRRLSLDQVSVQTDRDYVRPLTDLFRRRARRMKGYG